MRAKFKRVFARNPPVDKCIHLQYFRLTVMVLQIMSVLILVAVSIARLVTMDFGKANEFTMSLIFLILAIFITLEQLQLTFVSTYFSFLKYFWGKALFYFFVSGLMLQHTDVHCWQQGLGIFYLLFVFVLCIFYFVEREHPTHCDRPITKGEKKEEENDEDIEKSEQEIPYIPESYEELMNEQRNDIIGEKSRDEE